MSDTQIESLKRRVDEIISYSDDERAHICEDELHRELLKEYLPPLLWEEIDRLDKADFARWCA